MRVLHRPNGVLEAHNGPFRCRLQPLPGEVGYRVMITHHRPSSRFTDYRLIFNTQDPQEIVILLQITKAVVDEVLAMKD